MVSIPEGRERRVTGDSVEMVELVDVQLQRSGRTLLCIPCNVCTHCFPHSQHTRVSALHKMRE